MRFHVTLVFLFLNFLSFANEENLRSFISQNPDSVLNEAKLALKKTADPLERAGYLHTIGLCQHEQGETHLAIQSYLKEGEILHKYAKQEIELDIENKLALSNSYYTLGELITADSILQLSYLSLPKINNYSLQINVLLQTGWLSRERGRHSEALGYYLDALVIAENSRDEIQMANAYARIAFVYHVMEDYKTAERYYDQALELYQKLGLKKEEGRLYNNYGLLYQDREIPVKAIYYYEKSIEMCQAIGNTRGAAIAKENLGVVCFEYLKNNTVAIDHFDYSLNVWRTMGDIYGQAQNLVYKVNVYLDQNDFRKVVDTAQLAVDLARKSGAKDVERDALFQLSKGFEGLNKIEDAYHSFFAYVSLKDSLESLNNFEKINLMSQRHELQKIHVQDSLNMVIEYNNNKAIVEAQYKEQRFWTILLSSAFIALIIIVFILIRSRNKQVQSAKIIADTNTILKTKNREIIDSITYAKNIQNSILPTEEDIHRLFPSHFLYYRPKDIVAGDFYWIQETQGTEPLHFLAVADCTGHGVPGAMVSIVCANALNKSVVEMKLTKPAEILEEVNKIVRQNLSRGTQQLNDGMDICLLAIKKLNASQFEVQYSGANNPLWYIRKGVGELEEIKATKRPVGDHIIVKAFENHTHIFEKGDLLYLFTDGYADQFGGPRQKKFNYKSLKDLFSNHHNESLARQKEIYDQIHQEWKNDYDQIDDICVMGVKL